MKNHEFVNSPVINSTSSLTINNWLITRWGLVTAKTGNSYILNMDIYQYGKQMAVDFTPLL